ncbi:MAG: hypothetical protein KIT31_41440, partial [Deltaproteobacteria bacterium]|nr:hypothetical protein [Deltaproteobacteria bacterium]
MPRALPEIDRLIEEGLTLYGQGDLSGALLVWEEALGIDPENPQANSYVDYVRMNYALLTTEAEDDGAFAPFGIAVEDSDYQVEIVRPDGGGGDGGPAELAYADPDEPGWYIEHEPREPSRREALSAEALEGAATIERVPHANGEPPARAASQGEVSFEDQTSEYAGGARKSGAYAVPSSPPQSPSSRSPSPSPSPSSSSQSSSSSPSPSLPAPRTREPSRPGAVEFPLEMTPTPGFDSMGVDSITPGFDSVSAGFGSQVTDIRKRDLGFVQPTKPSSLTAQDLPLPPPADRSSSPELKRTLRTPSLDAFDREEASADGDAAWEDPRYAPPPPSAEIELTYDDDVDDDAGEPAPPAPPKLDPSAAELLDCLPSPTPAPSLAALRPPTGGSQAAIQLPRTESPLRGSQAAPGNEEIALPAARQTGSHEAVPPTAVVPPVRQTGSHAVTPPSPTGQTVVPPVRQTGSHAVTPTSPTGQTVVPPVRQTGSHAVTPPSPTAPPVRQTGSQSVTPPSPTAPLVRQTGSHATV